MKDRHKEIAKESRLSWGLLNFIWWWSFCKKMSCVCLTPRTWCLGKSSLEVGKSLEQEGCTILKIDALYG